MNKVQIFDPLYGPIEICEEISLLIRCPLVQRLRNIRLSNIDSISMPGIANISRFEHSIGASFLASQLDQLSSVSNKDQVILQAAALIHDTAIAPFGHLAEEAMNYAGKYKHETKWALLFEFNENVEVGGIDLQVFLGRESGLRKWAVEVFGNESNAVLGEIFAAVTGKGRFGPFVAGEIDLDNLDNVTRMAYHMGLNVSRELPLKIAQCMRYEPETDGPVYLDHSVDLIQEWLNLRHSLYDHLMLSRDDFCGKVMLLSAAVQAIERNCLSKEHWSLTDDQFVQALLNCNDKDVRETASRWFLGDTWSLSDLFWFDGTPPSFSETQAFAQALAELLGRQCFAYRIKDKRTRSLNLTLASRRNVKLGYDPTKWILGVGSSKRKAFSFEENDQIAGLAERFFSTRFIGNDNLNSAELFHLHG
jgi:HD superfamily phosphohydrolase